MLRAAGMLGALVVLCVSSASFAGPSDVVDQLDAKLVSGQSTMEDVRRLPMHAEARAVWNYLEQDAGRDEFSGYFLMLFFDDQVLGGYLWYTIEDLAYENSAPDWLLQSLEK
jgi:hypothetical protein